MLVFFQVFHSKFVIKRFSTNLFAACRRCRGHAGAGRQRFVRCGARLSAVRAPCAELRVGPFERHRANRKPRSTSHEFGLWCGSSTGTGLGSMNSQRQHVSLAPLFASFVRSCDAAATIAPTGAGGALERPHQQQSSSCIQPQPQEQSNREGSHSFAHTTRRLFRGARRESSSRVQSSTSASATMTAATRAREPPVLLVIPERTTGTRSKPPAAQAPARCERRCRAPRLLEAFQERRRNWIEAAGQSERKREARTRRSEKKACST